MSVPDATASTVAGSVLPTAFGAVYQFHPRDSVAVGRAGHRRSRLAGVQLEGWKGTRPRSSRGSRNRLQGQVPRRRDGDTSPWNPPPERPRRPIPAPAAVRYPDPPRRSRACSRRLASRTYPRRIGDRGRSVAHQEHVRHAQVSRPGWMR